MNSQYISEWWEIIRLMRLGAGGGGAAVIKAERAMKGGKEKYRESEVDGWIDRKKSVKRAWHVFRLFICSEERHHFGFIQLMCTWYEYQYLVLMSPTFIFCVRSLHISISIQRLIFLLTSYLPQSRCSHHICPITCFFFLPSNSYLTSIFHGLLFINLPFCF